MTRQSYDTDLTNQEWAKLEPYFSKHRTYKWSKRELVNATLSITKTGCQWHMLPHDFPPYPTVWSFCRRAKESGLWDTILTELVKKRLKAGRAATPTYAIIDSQSVKTTDVAEERGIDGGKKVKGRKRHIVVDTMGNLLDVVVHAAHLHDTKSGFLVARKVMGQFPTIKAFSADAGYRKRFEEMMLEEFGCPVDVSEKIKGNWQIIPKPWVVERTFLG